MQKVIDKINEILKEKFDNKQMVKDNLFESIFYQATSSFNYKNTFGLSSPKKGKTRTYIVLSKKNHVTPFVLHMQKTPHEFRGHKEFSYTSVSVQDMDVKNVMDKSYTEVMNECQVILDKKDNTDEDLIKEKEDTIRKTLVAHNMTYETFTDLINTHSEWNELRKK